MTALADKPDPTPAPLLNIESHNPSDGECIYSAAELLVTSLSDGTLLTAP